MHTLVGQVDTAANSAAHAFALFRTAVAFPTRHRDRGCAAADNATAARVRGASLVLPMGRLFQPRYLLLQDGSLFRESVHFRAQVIDGGLGNARVRPKEPRCLAQILPRPAFLLQLLLQQRYLHSQHAVFFFVGVVLLVGIFVDT